MNGQTARWVGWRWLGVVVAVTILALGGCAGRPASVPTVRIAVIPILDVLPLYVAESEGYFADEGVSVTLVPAASAAERDQMLQAGQVDGIISDLVGLALFNRPDAGSGDRVVAVRYGMVPTPDAAVFRILASGTSQLATPADLAGVPIGVSEGTVIAYITDRILRAEGVAPDQITMLAVPNMPQRMALLTAGELQAATLAEPLASLAVQQGARVIADDRQHIELSCSVFSFRGDMVDKNPEAIRRVMRAVNRASDAINADKGRWQGILTDKQLVPTPLTGTFQLPDFPGAAVPTEAQYADVVAWLQETGRLTTAPAYNDVVDATLAK